ncbi:MAG: hypothetical protein EXQ91_01610 [Alphaproteobacteria bacterium]|nr:hypothetical protein [Alphaproteobacteria bacterium]
MTLQAKQDDIRVYWQPHCSSCAFVKQYLTKHQIPFESINVLEHKTAYQDMARIGAKSVPLVARGDRFVYAQSIADVAAFVGIKDNVVNVSPQALIDRMDSILAASARYARQIPDAKLGENMPNRPRSYRVLAHHAFRVVDAFLDSVDREVLTYESLTREPTPDLVSSARIASYGDEVRKRLRDWWNGWPHKRGEFVMKTYYGAKPMSEVLLRTASHAGQHSRQLAEILSRMNIAPDRPLPESTYDGLLIAEQALDN